MGKYGWKIHFFQGNNQTINHETDSVDTIHKYSIVDGSLTIQKKKMFLI